MKFIYTIIFLILLSFNQSHAQEWKTFGNLNESRSHFQAIQITNDEILIIGGETNSKLLNSCEIININTGQISYTAPLNVARSQFNALMTKDSNVVVVGGFTNTVEMFDTKKRVWTQIGELQELRLQHNSVLLDDDNVLVIGGRDGTIFPIASAEIYNLKTNTSSFIKDLPSRFSSGVALRNSLNNIWCFGGRAGGANSERLVQIIEFNDKDKSWSPGSKLKDSVQNITAIRLNSGSIFACNGSISEKPVKHSYQTIYEKNGKLTFGKTLLARQWHYCSELTDNEVLICGGFNDSLQALRQTEIFDLQSNSSKFYNQTISEHVNSQLVKIETNKSKRIFFISGFKDVFKTLTPIVEVLEISK